MNDKWVNQYKTTAHGNSYTTSEAYSPFNEYSNVEDRRGRQHTVHEHVQRRTDRSRSPIAAFNYDEFNCLGRDLQVNFKNRSSNGTSNFQNRSSNGTSTYGYEHKQQTYQDLQGDYYNRNTESRPCIDDFHSIEEQNRYNVQDNFYDTIAASIPDNFQQDQGGGFPGMLNDAYEPEDKLGFEDNYTFDYHHGQMSMGHSSSSDFFNTPELNSNSNRNEPTHFQQPQVKTAAPSQHESKVNTNLNLYITDRSEPDGKILDKVRESALRKALFDMLFKELLSDDFSVRPRFKSCRMFDGIFKVMAADEVSARFLKDRVEKMPPPWLGAKLFVDYKIRRQFTIEALVPGVRIGWRKVFAEIRSFDPNICVEKWQQMGIREHTLGHVFTYAIDFESYNLLDKHGGSIPYGDKRIEFRVLRNDDS